MASRGLFLHDRSTAVGQVRLLRAQERIENQLAGFEKKIKYP